MKVPWITPIAHINWNRFAIVVGVAFVFWAGLSEIVPIEYHKPIMVTIGSVQAALTFALRATKYVEREGVPPPPGVQP